MGTRNMSQQKDSVDKKGKLRGVFRGRTAITVLLLVLAVSLTASSVWYLTGGVSSPSVGWTVTGGAVGPCTWFISMDGTTPIARAMQGGLSVAPGDNLVGTAGQDVSAFLSTNGLIANKNQLCFSTNTFVFTTTLVINKGVSLIGQGAGLLWNAYEFAPTEIKCQLSSNSVPCIKIVGDSSLSIESDAWTVIRDLKLYYSGSSTGTDGIYLDGETTVVRHISFDRINIVKFSRIGIHSKGTVFDIQSYNVGVVNSQSDNVKIEVGTPIAGDPTQFFFYGLVSLANAAGSWALNVQMAYDFAIYGGTISGSGLANGTRIIGKTAQAPIYGVQIEGVNFEGTNGANSVGLLYATGSNLRLTGSVFLNWGTGILIGGFDLDSTVANGYFIDVKIGTVVNGVIVTRGAPRRGILGPQTMESSVGIVNHRATQDGVYSDLTEWFPDGLSPQPAAITVTASVFQYVNRDWYNEMVYISGGTVSNITLTHRNSGSGQTTNIQLSSTTNISVFVLPGEFLWVTYSVIPVMIHQYGGP